MIRRIPLTCKESRLSHLFLRISSGTFPAAGFFICQRSWDGFESASWSYPKILRSWASAVSSKRGRIASLIALKRLSVGRVGDDV